MTLPPDEGISWNYTTWLNIAFLLLAMMGGGPDAEQHAHHHDRPDGTGRP